ncbi:protein DETOXIFICATION 16-like isoform X1 [Senna tora]|uniref:Protein DETOXIFICATION n=1 Tax=Senna tora TaxID=362788 RepID=A0A834WK81_9FABA|nr:protein DETOXIFICATION 16-like isoform X1 [Senna tora]
MWREEEDEDASLRSRLIQNAHEDDDDGLKVVDVERNKENAAKKTNVLEEVWKQLWLAGPLICVSLLNYCLQVISLMFIGRLGELPFSGASMATSFASVTGSSLLKGMANALDTLCGQSYGAKQHHMLGIHMQRSMLVLTIVSIPLSVVWANTRPLLIASGQDPEISEKAGKYAILMIPSLFPYALLQCLNRFLKSQNIVFPMVFSSGFTTLLHVVVCWLLVFKSGLGYRGPALANAISYWVNVLVLALYVKFSPSCSETWTGFSREAFQNIPSFLDLAIPSAVMICNIFQAWFPIVLCTVMSSLETWSFEMVVLLSGLLPNPKLETSVLSICLNTSAIFWVIPLGLGAAISTRVSNELGAGNPRAARSAVYVVLIMAIIVGILVGAVMILIRNVWGYAYSNDEQVVQYVASMLPILAASNFVDGLQSVLTGTARGCGRQKTGAFVNLGSYYIIGIPSAMLFTFVWHIGGKGLWLGILCALVVQVSCLLTITIRTDWEEEAKKARDSLIQ